VIVPGAGTIFERGSFRTLPEARTHSAWILIHSTLAVRVPPS